MSFTASFEDDQFVSNSVVSEDIAISIKKLFNNPNDLAVGYREEWKCPKIGDKVEIISYDTQVHVQECVRVCKLPYLTVKEVFPQVVGFGEDKFYWSYSISVEETHLKFLQYHYKILN